MAKKKNKKKQPIVPKRKERMKKARSWISTYKGEDIVGAYREQFKVDVFCAVRELQEIGHQFPDGFAASALRAEQARIQRVQREKEKKQAGDVYNDWQDDNFFFIAGHTSGGAPYGVQWWEMGLEPWESPFDEDGDDEIICYRHYEFLRKWEKDSVDNRLREDFSKYVSKYKRLPSKNKKEQLIKQVFETCGGEPVLYDKDFNAVYRKLVRKRENKFIQEGVLPKRFTPTEIKNYFEQSVMLESERLIFRKITQADFDNLAAMLRDPEVTAAWEHTFTDEQIQKWIDNQILRYQNEIAGYFAAVRKDTGEFIGQMGLLWSDFDELRALETVYMLKRECWGMGYATEGAAALAEYGFTVIGLNKVYASIRPDNQRAIRVAERIGMSAEGSFAKQYDGKLMEHIIYAKSRGGSAGVNVSIFENAVDDVSANAGKD